MDNVVPLYDLFEGNFYSIWQRIIIFCGIGIIICLPVYWYLKDKIKEVKLWK